MCLEKQRQVSCWVYTGHSPAERKAAEAWLCLPFLSVKGSDLTDLFVTLIESFFDSQPWNVFKDCVLHGAEDHLFTGTKQVRVFHILGAVTPASYFVSSVCKQDSSRTRLSMLL